MLINNRKDLLDLFDKCGELARYHVEESKNCALRGDIDDAYQHKKVVDKYIDVRWDIIKLLEKGSA